MNFTHRFSTIQLMALLFSGIMLLYSTVNAAKKPQEPINIEADQMTSQERNNSVIFSGDVDARQGELLIRTDKMTVYYVPGENSGSMQGSSDVDKLICEGNVQISQGDWLGTGERMDYFAGERKVVLTGNAKGWQGQSMVSGKTITYFLDDGRSIVDGQPEAKGKSVEDKPGRVKAVIRPGAEKK